MVGKVVAVEGGEKGLFWFFSCRHCSVRVVGYGGFLLFSAQGFCCLLEVYLSVHVLMEADSCCLWCVGCSLAVGCFAGSCIVVSASA